MSNITRQDLQATMSEMNGYYPQQDGAHVGSAFRTAMPTAAYGGMSAREGDGTQPFPVQAAEPRHPVAAIRARLDAMLDEPGTVQRMDNMKLSDWLDLIDKRSDEIAAGHMNNGEEFRAAMITLGAEVVAMIQSYERRVDRGAPDGN